MLDDLRTNAASRQNRRKPEELASSWLTGKEAGHHVAVENSLVPQECGMCNMCTCVGFLALVLKGDT